MTTCEAKEIYLNWDCSYFLMCKNDYSGYVEYRRLEVPGIQEIAWKSEKIQSLYKEIQETGEYRLFRRFYALAEEFRDSERLYLVLTALARLEKEKPWTFRQRVEIAEMIIGKKFLNVRSGMIYWAYDIGQKQIAVLLLEIALQYLKIPYVTEIELERRMRRGRHLCDKIEKDLKLLA